MYPLFLQSEYALIPFSFSCILLGSYLLDAEMKEVEESPEVDLSACPIEKEISDASVYYKVL